ncbi:MAG TPA: PilZ domain-containing protein [Polyangia bacterium]|nr:PilZ domain-containing protein [Polyangia bacterium]
MRRHSRKVVELATVVSEHESRVEGGLRLDARDLSLGGAFLRSDLLYEVGEELQIQIQIPGGRAIVARARVVNVSREQSDGQTPGMGIAFVDLADADREAVRAHLARGE